MARLFISHSSANNPEAVALRDWLGEEGWDDVFLDVDPSRGIEAGERWERKLNEAASRCEAVLFLVSRAWLDSRWCLKEFHLARKLNKRLFGVVIEAIPITGLPEDLTGTWQVVDLAVGQDHRMFRAVMPRTHEEAHVTFSKEGLARLKGGLARAGLDPRFFAWPPPDDPNRPPYRGLKPLEAEDAGIFFGRDAPVIEALDTLRGLKEAAAPRILVILGASGAGKSSFLRAGLLPRLARDDLNFLPLPLIRPERAVLSGESGLLRALEAALAAEGLAKPRVKIREAIAGGAEALRPLLRELVDKAFGRLAGESGAKPPVIVLTIDQTEELFLSGGHEEAEALLALVSDLVRNDEPGILALMAIRSDSYDRLETAKALESLRQQTLPLLPMPRGAYQTVIQGPAARLKRTNRKLAIEPRLTQRLLEDIEEGGGSDALPLLAFTLEQLYLDYGGSGELKLADYVAFGGIRGAIEAAVGRALAAADADARIPRDRDARLALLRRGFIPWLAGVDPETGSPRRLVTRLADIPAEAAPLINLLVEQRLLSTDRVIVREGDKETSEITIEPAHEALLRQWGLLRGWLEEDIGALTTLEGVKRAARDWTANGRDDDWLNHAGTRLEYAEHVAARGDLAADLTADARDYLHHCREREEKERDELLAREREKQERLTQIAAAQARTARLQRIARRTLAAIAMVVAIGLGMVFWQQTRLNAQQLALAHGRANLLGELSAGARLRDDWDAALRLAVHGVLIEPALDGHAATGSRPRAELAAAVAQCEWRMRLSGHEDWVRSAAFSPDGTRIVTASFDRTARIWDATTGKETAVLRGHAEALLSAVFSSDGTRIVTASDDKTARIWDVASAREVAVLHGHADKLRSAAFSPHGKRIVTASRDGSARIWDAASGREITILRGHADGVMSAAFSPDGSRIVTASFDKTARIWDADTAKEITVLRGHTAWVMSAAFNRDGTRIVTASEDNTARVWDAASGKEVMVLRGHETPVMSAVFSPDGTRIVTASDDKTARIWDAATGQPLAVLHGHGSFVRSAAFSPDGTRIVTASADLTARIWDAAPVKEIARLSGHGGAVASAAFSPDGTRIVTASDDRTARIWDAATGKEIAVLRGHQDRVTSAAFSPDGMRIVTTSADQTARIWDAATAKEIAALLGHGDVVTSAAFNPDGTRIVTASNDMTARIWDAATEKEIAVLRGHQDRVTAVAYSPDGTRIVTGSEDDGARIWNAATAAEIAVLQGHDDMVYAAAYSPDGSRIVTASDDRTTRIWDAATGKQIAVQRGHEDKVRSAAFSRDGSRIVTAANDKTARIWDAATGMEIAVQRGHEDKVRFAAFSPDATRIVTASDDETARVWDVHFATMATKDLVAEACTRRLDPHAKLPREEMRFAGYPDDAPDVDVCTGVK